MKSTLSLAGLLCVTLGGLTVVLAQEAPAPRIALSQDSWNFGEVWHPQGASLTLVVKNEGTADLRIKDVRTTCGCTLAESGRDLVPPGETTEIKVRYNSEGKQGHQESKVIIESNDPGRPTVEMQITGEVKRAVKWTPIGGFVVKTLDTKPGQTGTLRLENQMPEPMHVKLTASNLQHLLDVEIKEITPGMVYDVIGRTKQELGPGSTTRGTLVFTTGLAKEEKLTIHARIQVLSRVELVPPIIYLDAKRENAPSQRSVSLQFYGEGPFAVSEAKANHPDIKVTLRPSEPPSGGLENIVPKMTALVRTTVSLPPASTISPEGAVIEYTTNDPAFPKLEVRVTTDPHVWQALIQGPPQPAVKPL
jgi:hypothetical protein